MNVIMSAVKIAAPLRKVMYRNRLKNIESSDSGANKLYSICFYLIKFFDNFAEANSV